MKQRSVIRAIDILTLLSESLNGLSLNEIVEATDIPKTTVYEILLMLQEKAMVQVDESRVRKYQLGVQAFVIGSRFVRNLELVHTAAPVVDACSEELGQTVFLAMLDGHEIIYLYKKEPENVVIHTESVGNRAEVYCTSLGKAIISSLPDHELQSILDKVSYRKRTSRTHTNHNSLKEDLNECRKRGYAIDDREVLDFVYCVGAPVFDHRGKAVAGISCAGLYSDERDHRSEGGVLKEAAMKLSRRLGFDPGRKPYGGI
ncbi:MAG: IclR family transcriptional regulator [Spirochaetales bacterium]|nr:IclR family transcriptional regulator [Spirochaetales bacterium]